MTQFNPAYRPISPWNAINERILKGYGLYKFAAVKLSKEEEAKIKKPVVDQDAARGVDKILLTTPCEAADPFEQPTKVPELNTVSAFNEIYTYAPGSGADHDLSGVRPKCWDPGIYDDVAPFITGEKREDGEVLPLCCGCSEKILMYATDPKLITGGTSFGFTDPASSSTPTVTSPLETTAGPTITTTGVVCDKDLMGTVMYTLLVTYDSSGNKTVRSDGIVVRSSTGLIMQRYYGKKGLHVGTDDQLYLGQGCDYEMKCLYPNKDRAAKVLGACSVPIAKWAKKYPRAPYVEVEIHFARLKITAKNTKYHGVPVTVTACDNKQKSVWFTAVAGCGLDAEPTLRGLPTIAVTVDMGGADFYVGVVYDKLRSKWVNPSAIPGKIVYRYMDDGTVQVF